MLQKPRDGGGQNEGTGNKGQGKGIAGEKHFWIVQGGIDSENPKG